MSWMRGLEPDSHGIPQHWTAAEREQDEIHRSFESAKDKVVRSTPTREIQVFLSPASRRYLEIEREMLMEAEEEAAGDEAGDAAGDETDDVAGENGGGEDHGSEEGGEEGRVGGEEVGGVDEDDVRDDREGRVVESDDSREGDVRSQDVDEEARQEVCVCERESE